MIDSISNAIELGDRTWNNNGKYGKRRALVEEAQEVRALFINPNTGREIFGQVALDSIRNYPDLYRQLPSRYILIGHSMGGVVAREYVQNSDYYHGDVDKVITLDSPHEGTGALNMQITKEGRDNLFNQALDNFKTAAPLAGVMSVPFFLVKGSAAAVQAGIYTLGISMAIQELSNPITRLSSPEIYYGDDPLVHYVDPLQSGYGTIDSLNKLNYTADSLPMFRILASKYRDRFSGYAPSGRV